MSGSQEVDRDFSRYNHMSTEELEEILRADFALPEDEESDMEKILYITEVIAGRRAGQPTGRYANVDAAWESFVDNYLPAEQQAAFREDENVAGTPKTKSKKGKSRFWKTMLARVAVVVVAVSLTLAVGSVTASAFGFNFWAWLTAWTQEVFGIQDTDTDYLGVSSREIPEQLAELYAAMKENGFPDELLPTYLPAGYETVEAKCEAHLWFVSANCYLKNNDAPITLDYTMYLTDQIMTNAQKDEDSPDVYKVKGVVHHIMTNIGIYSAVWTVDNVKCSIYGVESREELIEMIESIYGGKT